MRTKDDDQLPITDGSRSTNTARGTYRPVPKFQSIIYFPLITNVADRPVSLKNVLNDVSLESTEKNQSAIHLRQSSKPVTDSKKKRQHSITSK